MKQQPPKRTKWLTIRMTPEEYQAAEGRHGQSTCSSLSEYARKAVLGKPVVLRYRNDSLDDFLTDMQLLKKELTGIGNNFNQAVHRLYGLRNLPEIQQWLMHNEQDKTQLFQQIETILQKINQIHQQWSRE